MCGPSITIDGYDSDELSLKSIEEAVNEGTLPDVPVNGVRIYVPSCFVIYFGKRSTNEKEMDPKTPLD